jgi:CheY-like chemotaxis protein
MVVAMFGRQQRTDIEHGAVETARARPVDPRIVVEALETLRKWRPDVLISDIEMPGEDGYSLIRKVRALPAADGGRTPAVALTAYGRTQDRTQSLTAGFSMHVPKPVDPGEFTAIVASLASRPSG